MLKLQYTCIIFNLFQQFYILSHLNAMKERESEREGVREREYIIKIKYNC